MFKIATWNVNSLRVRLPQVLDWLDTEAPDILTLQETKLQDRDFPRDAISDAGYQVVFAGQKTYNGVAVLSKQPVEVVATGLPGMIDPARRVLGVRHGDLMILDLYVPNGAAVDSDKYVYKLAWLDCLIAYVRDLLARGQDLVVLGDFNIAPEDRDVHDPAAWEGKILVSAPERERLSALLAADLSDAYRLFEQAPDSFSWWDYRAAAFRRNRGMRIDLVLLSAALVGQCRACWIDPGPRAWERPSDHAPVVVELDGSHRA